MTNLRLAPLVLATALLSACVSPAPERPSQPAPVPRPPITLPVPPTEPPPPPTAGFRQPEIIRDAGLESIVRQNAAALERRFGTPRLDVHEGDMRKLQFTGAACVLDVFLYPLSPNAEPVATWVEARRASDGAAVDRAACVRSLVRSR